MFQFAVALEAAQRFAAHARRRARANAQVANLNGLAEPQWNDSFTNGVEVAGGAQGQRGTPPSVLQSGCFGAAELPLVGTDDPTFVPFAALNVLRGGIGAGHPLDRGMELELETGDSPMPRSRPLKRLSDGELAELRAQLIDLLDRGWIQHSTAGHAAAVVFAHKPTGRGAFATTTGA